MALDNTDAAPEEPEINCDSSLTSVPSEFVPDIIKNFCPEAMESEGGIHAAGRAYDIYGDRIPNLRKRSPPESAENYEDYRFFLHWEPTDGECIIDTENLCEDAFDAMRRDYCEFHPNDPLKSAITRSGNTWLIGTCVIQAAKTTAQQETE